MRTSELLEAIYPYVVGWIQDPPPISGQIVFDNPSVTSGDGLFITHDPRPYTVDPTGAMSLIHLDVESTEAVQGANPFYVIKLEFKTDKIDTGAGLAIFNDGNSDNIYLNVAGKPGAGPYTDNAPTGIGIDVNKQIAGSAEQSSDSNQQGIQIWDHSTTDQGNGGPRCLFLNKYGNMDTDHLLSTFRANGYAIQLITKSDTGSYDGNKLMIGLADEVSGQYLWRLRVQGDQIFRENLGLQWEITGGTTAYVMGTSSGDLKLKSGGSGIRLTNQADTNDLVYFADDGLITSLYRTATANAPVVVWQVRADTSGTAASGFGPSILFQADNAAGSQTNQTRIISQWDGDTTRGRLRFMVWNSGAESEGGRFEFDPLTGVGKLIVNKIEWEDGSNQTGAAADIEVENTWQARQTIQTAADADFEALRLATGMIGGAVKAIWRLLNNANSPRFEWQALGSEGAEYFRLNYIDQATSLVGLMKVTQAGAITLDNLNVGIATGATTGGIRASGNVRVTNTAPAFMLDETGGSYAGTLTLDGDTLQLQRWTHTWAAYERTPFRVHLDATDHSLVVTNTGRVVTGAASGTDIYSAFPSQNNRVFEAVYSTSIDANAPFPALVLAKNVPSPTADRLMGAVIWANQGAATADKRLAQISGYVMSGDNDSGYLVFSTVSGGTIAEVMRLNNAGAMLIGDIANANLTRGLTINQGANDDEILAFKSSDVAHGVTGVTETDTYATFLKVTAASGGLLVRGLTGATIGLNLIGLGTTGDTTKSTASSAYVEARGYIKSGTGAATPGANENIFAVRSGGDTKWIVDTEGDTHRDGTDNTYDDWDDAQLARALTLELAPGATIRSEFDRFLRYNRDDLIVAGILSTEGFYNESALLRLLTGAIWQQYMRLAYVEQMLDALREN